MAAGGGGGTSRHSNGYTATPSSASNSFGGAGRIVDGSYGTWKCAAGGGAGITPGAGAKSGSARSTSAGVAGSGGLLVILSNSLVSGPNCKYTAIGAAGGNSVAGGGSGDYGSASAGGGGSGGGSVNIFIKDTASNVDGIASYINVSGGSGGVGSGGSSSCNATGGAGGTGSYNVGYLDQGTYVPLYRNT